MSDPDDRDMLAAEYVLGTLAAAERTGFASRLAADPALAEAVGAWEQRLSPLLDGVPEVAPPADAYAAIAARLFGTDPSRAAAGTAPAVAVLRRRVRAWQAATAGFAALAAGLLAWVAVRGGATPPVGQRYTAVLQRDGDAPAMVVNVDLAAHRLTVRPVAAVAPQGRAFELWIIDPALGAPRSLGIVSDGGARETLGRFGDEVIANATYAVTVEAPGGSPTGRPTTAPILSGKLSPWSS